MPAGMNTVSYAELMSLFATGKVAHTVYSGRVVEALGYDVPGVMTAAAGHSYLNRYGVAVGREVLVQTQNDANNSVNRCVSCSARLLK